MTDRREERQNLKLQGKIRTGTAPAREVVISDLTSEGCKFFDKFSSLKADTQLGLRIGPFGPLDAEVRWREAEMVGVLFRPALHPSVLEHILIMLDEDKLEAAE